MLNKYKSTGKVDLLRYIRPSAKNALGGGKIYSSSPYDELVNYLPLQSRSLFNSLSAKLRTTVVAPSFNSPQTAVLTLNKRVNKAQRSREKAQRSSYRYLIKNSFRLLGLPIIEKRVNSPKVNWGRGLSALFTHLRVDRQIETFLPAVSLIDSVGRCKKFMSVAFLLIK